MRVRLAVALAGLFVGFALMTQSDRLPPGHYVGTVSQNPHQFTSLGGMDQYAAVESSKHRRTASGIVRPEDKILDATRRKMLASNAMDLHRNAVLFAWAVRRHLDYTTLFDFQPQTGDAGLDRDLRDLMADACRPRNCDVGGRHSWNKIRRLAEVRKLLDGDCGLLLLRSGHVQGIESHAIRNPRMVRTDATNWDMGVKLGPGRRAVAYCLEDRGPNGLLRERVVPRSRLLLLASFEGRFDQIRGISPVAGALNEFRDVYETKELMQAKVKLDQIFGVAFMRNADATSLADEFGVDGSTESEDPATAASADPGPPPSYDLGQNVKGFDMDKDEDIKLLQSTNPSSQTQEFLQLSIAIAIKALDLPFNFFDESRTNFFGSKAAWIQYDRACQAKREDQLELHREWTVWQMRRWLLPRSIGGTGELVLPAGRTLTDVKWRWVNRGMPWWNPQEELTVDLMAAAAGLKTMQTICDERGLGVWRDNLAGLAAEFGAARDAGFTLAFQPQKLPLSLSFTGSPQPEPVA